MTDTRTVEAVLFASGHYLSPEEIAELAGVDEDNIDQIIHDLIQQYDDMGSALTIFEENNKYKMNVIEDYSYVVRRVVSEAELSDALMETLALIAYKAPVLQSDIIDARSARAYDHIHRLENRGFVEREREGRTYKLHVTDKFYSYFDVTNRNELGQVFEAVQPPDVDVVLDPDDEEQEATDEEEFEDFLSDRLREVNERDTEAEERFLNDIEDRLDQVREDVDNIEPDVDDVEDIDAEEGQEADEDETPTEP